MGEFHEMENVPLSNNTSNEFQSQKFVMNKEKSEVDYEFDDQFEEDIMDKKILRNFLQQQRYSNSVETHEKNELDLSSSRWIAYDVFARTLER